MAAQVNQIPRSAGLHIRNVPSELSFQIGRAQIAGASGIPWLWHLNQLDNAHSVEQ